jgi:hypothetical protein
MSKIQKKLSSTLAPLFSIILNCKILLLFTNEHKQGITIFGIIRTFLLEKNGKQIIIHTGMVE